MSRLENFGIKKSINKTRLKVQLLEHFPEAQELFDGRNVIIFKEGMKNMLRNALKLLHLSVMTFSIIKGSNLQAPFHRNVKKTPFL